MKAGDRVKFTNPNDFYIRYGALGTVIEIWQECTRVDFDQEWGTRGDWICSNAELEPLGRDPLNAAVHEYAMAELRG